MSAKKILVHNDKQFLVDIKLVREVMVYSSLTGTFFKVLKRQVLNNAEKGKVHYYLTDKIFVVKRLSMVII